MKHWRSHISNFVTLVVAALCAVPAPGYAEDRLKQLVNIFGPDWIDGVTTPATKKVGPASLAFPAFAGQPDTLPGAPPPGAEMTPTWLPMCFLFDPSVDAGIANHKIKAMAAAYAACGIALEPYVFTIKSNYPDDFKAVSALAKAACPFQETLGVRGAVQVETRSAQIAAEMCSDPQAKGCSTLCAPLSVSFVAPNSGSVVGLHESMHSNCCGPVCVDSGQGTGPSAGPNIELARNFPWSPLNGMVKKKYFASTTNPGAAGISAEGCKALRAGAAQNDFNHWYVPQRNIYYVAEPNPARQRDLTARKSFLPEPLIAAKAAPTNLKGTEAAASPRVVTPDYTTPTAKSEERWSPPPVLRGPASSTEVLGVGEDGEPMWQSSQASSRKRGTGLRKAGDPKRKEGDEIGIVNAYGGGGSGGDSVD